MLCIFTISYTIVTPLCIPGLIPDCGFHSCPYRLRGVMVRVLVSSAKGRGFDPRPGQTKDTKIDISFFSAKLAAFSSNSKTGRTKIRIICLGKMARLPADCSFRELAL